MSDLHPKFQEKGLVAWFANNHVAANILMLLFLIGGVLSVSAMRTETFPSIDPRLISVSVIYPGATPYEVSDSITSRVEEALLGIEGVKRITSTAAEGSGTIRVELEDFADADDVYNDVDTAVNSLSDFPPEDSERPIVSKVKVTPKVLSLALHGAVSEDLLKYWAEYLKDDLRQISGVADTTLRGIRDYQISVEIPENTLRKYGLSLQDVGNAIANYSIDIPAGTIEASQGEILLRVQEKKSTGEDFEKIVIKNLPDGSTLRLGDIGKVIDGFEDINLISRFNNERAAFIDVSRSDTGDTLSVAEDVKAFLQTVKLPKGLTLSLQSDETVVLGERISLMLRNAVLGFMLVFLILLLFLDLKLAFWTSAAIPISFLGGLMIIHFMGYSLNMISLFALIVVLGIVVDDAIVTGESIFEAQEKGQNDPNAVVRGVKSVIAPVTVGVTTTMAAFAPLIFSTGTLGQIIGIIPVVVIPILSVSLIEAYFILPAHLSSPGMWSKGFIASLRNAFSRGLVRFSDAVLLPAARFCITWRYATLALFIGAAIVTAGLFQSGLVRFVFFPQIEADEITINVTLPIGTPFVTTESTMLQIEEGIQDVREELGDGEQPVFKSISVSVGETASAQGPGDIGGENNSGSHLGQIIVQLVSSDFRNVSSGEIEGLIREKIKTVPNIDAIEFQSSLVGEEPDIDIELSHPDDETLYQASDELTNTLSLLAGMKEVTDSFEPGKTEYVFELTDEGHAVGLSPADLGNQLRSAFFGNEAQRFQRGRSEVIVYVRYPKLERERLETLSNARIRLPNGSEVPLEQVASIRLQPGYSQIETVNGRRIVGVTGDVDYSITTPNEVMAELENTIIPSLQARYSGLSYSFEGESREQQEDLQSLLRNMMIAMLLIYMLLGAQLRSYIQPLVIMTAIPFGVVGAIWGHFLLGYDLTFISLFGIVALSGVVVNDSVVLIDFFNKQRKSGLKTKESALAAIKRRFRPILLTTMTTSLGLLPILLETSMQARFLIPMVISLATGIIFATVIILLLVPCLILIVDDLTRIFKIGVPAKHSTPSEVSFT
ncbi:MAG: efflux RND transporter permease subunit [Desulfocapsaceae bacterium]|nr:efflux RND transporter permease subunit [Desulfocapsaceae bacterium]